MPTSITEHIDVEADVETAFDYVADFSNLEQWDPTFDDTEKTSPGEVGVGSRFHVKGGVGPAEMDIDYRITEFDRPRRVVLVGEGNGFTSVDTITFAPGEGGGTTVTYDAEVDSGAPDWVETLGTPVFKVVGKLAAGGMRDALTLDEVRRRRTAAR